MQIDIIADRVVNFTVMGIPDFTTRQFSKSREYSVTKFCISNECSDFYGKQKSVSNEKRILTD